MSTFPPRAGGGGCCLFLEVSFLLSTNQSTFCQFQNLIHDSVQKTLAPVWHKLISKKKNVKQDHKGTDKILDILALSPLWGNGLSQTWASIYLHVYCPYLHNVFMKGGGGVGVVYLGGTAKETVSQFKLSEGWSLYQWLLYVITFLCFFFNFKPSPCRLCSFAFSFFCISLKKLWASSIFAKLRPAL